MFGAHIWSPAYCRAQADTQAKENANVTPREGQLLAPTGRDPLSSSESMCLPRHFLLVAMQTDVKYLSWPKLPSEVKVDIACRQSPNLQWNLTWNYHWIFNCFLKYSTQVNISFSFNKKKRTISNGRWRTRLWSKKSSSFSCALAFFEGYPAPST